MKRAMSFLSYALIALIVAFAAFAVWVRVAPSDPARWHVDPATAARPSSPNWADVDRVVAMPVAEVRAWIAQRAEADGATVLAEDGDHVTWLARTQLMRYPDYISITLSAEGDGTRIMAFSRSRFGYGDAGVNRARLRRWLPE